MRRPGLVAALLLLPLAACGGEDEPDRTLTVLAAASLTDVFTDLAAEFEADHPGVEVELSFGSSTELAETAADQAPADVLATADETAMQIAVAAGVTADPPVEFATAEMVIATAPGNPEGIASLEDLDRVTWVRCGDDVPCGRVALLLLEDAGVLAEPVSLEVDVRAALEKVVSGEVDAGLVYASDAASAGDAVRTVAIPESGDALAAYFVAPLTQADDAALAEDWVALVQATAGRTALAEAGFGVP